MRPGRKGFLSEAVAASLCFHAVAAGLTFARLPVMPLPGIAQPLQVKLARADRPDESRKEPEPSSGTKMVRVEAIERRTLFGMKREAASRVNAQEHGHEMQTESVTHERGEAEEQRPAVEQANRGTASSQGAVMPPEWRAAYLDNPTPEYPARARRLGHEGEVRLQVLVGADGHPGEIRLARPSGSELLDRAALAAVRGWRFRPALSSGEAVTAWVEIPLHFRLDVVR